MSNELQTKEESNIMWYVGLIIIAIIYGPMFLGLFIWVGTIIVHPFWIGIWTFMFIAWCMSWVFLAGEAMLS